MNQILFNLYYASNHNYDSKRKYYSLFFQIIKLFHVIIITDIIFTHSDMKEKHFHFPLYFLSPILYLEHVLTKSNTNCINITNETLFNSSNDGIRKILIFVFGEENIAKSLLCNFDSYIIYISAIIGLTIILFILILFIPGHANKQCEYIGKGIYSVLYIFYVHLLHILFYFSTRKFIFHSTIIGYAFDSKTIIWIFLTLLLFVCSLVFNKFTHFGHCFLSYMIEDNVYDSFLSLLSALIINSRFTRKKFFFFQFFWLVLFIKKCYDLLWQFRYKLFSKVYEKIDFYINYFFLSYSFIRLIIASISCINGFKISEEHEKAFHVIELVLGIMMFGLFLMLAHSFLRKELLIQELISSLNNDNENGHFEKLLIVFMLKFVEYFEFRLLGNNDIKDRELILEMQKRRKEIIMAFKNQFVFAIKKEKVIEPGVIEELGKLNTNEDHSEVSCQFKKFITSTGGDDSNLAITDEMMLVHKFKHSLKQFTLNKVFSHKRMHKIESITNKEELNDAQDFKRILKIILKLEKMLKRHINSSFWNNNTKKDVYEFLILAKLICFCEFDESTNRAEFYVKKYLDRKAVSSKFKILIHFLDIKFRLFSLRTEDSMVHTIKMIEFTNKLLDLIKMFKYILEQFELNGDTDQKKLEIIESNNESVGICFSKVSSYAQLTDNQFKQNENSTYVKLKIAQQLLFSAELPDKIIEETDIQLAEIEFNKSNYFILNFERDKIYIQRTPAKYLERSGYKADDLYKKDYTDVMPKCFREAEYKNLKENIIKQGKAKFELIKFLLTRDNYILRSKIKYTMLPIISKDSLIFAEIDFNIKNFNTCFVVNSKNQIIEIGYGFKNFFGLNPNMLPLSISDIFDTNQPLQYKFLHNHQHNTLSLHNGQTITLNIEGYLTIYQYLRKLNGIKGEGTAFMENITKIFEANKTKDRTKISILFSKYDYLNKFIGYSYSAYSFMFPSTSGTPAVLDNSISKIAAIGTNLFQAGGGNSTNGISTLNGIDDLNMNLENRYTYCSTSSVSMSTNSLNKVKAVFSGKRGRNIKNKRDVNIPEILETIYGALLIIIVIILVILIQILSNDLVRNFSILKNIRLLTSSYYNGSFHLINKVIFNNNENYASVEHAIINRFPNTKPFIPYYQSEFEIINNNFFQQYNNFNSEIHKHLNDKFINEKINIQVQVIQNDGSHIMMDFIEALNIPKLNFYFLSRNPDYMESLPFIDSKENLSDELHQLTDIQQTLYVTLLNYQNILDKFLEVSENIRSMFYDKFKSYRVKIYLIFCCCIFINSLSFFLYAFNTSSTRKKILKVSESFFVITKKNITFLNQKLDFIKKIIEVEEHPSHLLNKMSKNIQKRKLGEKSIKSNESNKDSIKSSSLISLNRNEPQPFIDKSTNSKQTVHNQKSTGSHYVKIYCSVLTAISISHLLFIIYGVIVLPIISDLMSNILVIQLFTKEVTSVQRVALNYYLTLEIYILLNTTDEVINSGYVENYPSTFYESLKIIQNYMKINDDLTPIELYLNSLSGDKLCENAFVNNPDNNMINMCRGIIIQSSSWTNVLSHVIRTIRNLFYNFDSSPRALSDIEYYFHCKEMQELNIITFTLVQEMMDYVKDVKGMVTYENAINNFVAYVIVMAIALILLEVGNFIVITMKIVKKLKTTYNNFTLIEKFFTG